MLTRKLLTLAVIILATCWVIDSLQQVSAQSQAKVTYDLPDLTPRVPEGVLVCDNSEGFRTVYNRAVEQNRPIVLGVDVTPPVGDWIAAKVRSADVSYPSGQVVVATPVNSALYVKAKMASEVASPQLVQTALQPVTPLMNYYNPGSAAGAVTYYQTPTATYSAPMTYYSTPTYYQSTPTYYYSAPRFGLFGGRFFGGGCAGGNCGG